MRDARMIREDLTTQWVENLWMQAENLMSVRESHQMSPHDANPHTLSQDRLEP